MSRTRLGPVSPRRSAEAWRSAVTGGVYAYACNEGHTDVMGAAAMAVNSLFAMPFIGPPLGGIATHLLFEVTVAGGAGSKGRAGIYSNGPLTGGLSPDALIVDGGEFDTTIVGVKDAAIAVQLLPDTLYWLAYLCGTAAPTIRTGTGQMSICGIPGAFGSLANRISGLSQAQAYGALPAVYPGGGAGRFTGQYPFLAIAL